MNGVKVFHYGGHHHVNEWAANGAGFKQQQETDINNAILMKKAMPEWFFLFCLQI